VVFALLADNRLLAVRARDGAVVAEHQLAPTPLPLMGTGHYLALSNDGRLLFVLTPGALDTAPRVAVIEVATATVRATYSLSPEDGDYHNLAVGPRTGRLYLFGNRDEQSPSPPGRPRPGRARLQVVVTVLDPQSGAVQPFWTARVADGYEWLVYQGAVSDDERELFISYHGADASGIDWFTVADDGLRRCPAPARHGAGCIMAHGAFRLYGDGLLVSGGDTKTILEVDRTGTVRRGFDIGLPHSHLMEFVLDAGARRLYTVGYCGYLGGFSALDLDGGGWPTPSATPGTWRWLATPAPPRVLQSDQALCGSRLALGPVPLLVVATNILAAPNAQHPGALLFVDTRSGTIIRKVETPSEPADVLVAPAPQ
jgi:hypothetical protein